MKKSLFLLMLILFCSISFSQPIEKFIEVDQFGYLPNSDKFAVLRNPQIGFNSADAYTPSATIEVWNVNTNTLVYSGSPTVWDNGNIHNQSGDSGWWFDFSVVNEPGEYYLLDPSNNYKSPNFLISPDVYYPVLKAAGRMFYYNRCTIAKEEPYAQGWTDGASFNNPLQDSNCRYIFDQNNPALEKDLSGGWFDAGDYNKYVTFTHSTLHNLLSAYEENPDAFDDQWNIPESGNSIPDLIDEIIWELDWLQKMMNADGSVHIKMGNRNYSENTNSPPSDNFDGRYYGPTCSSASISVASIFAHAAKVFQSILSLSNYALTMLQKAEVAYNYSKTFVDTNTFQLDCDDGSIVAGDADLSETQQRAFFTTSAIYLFELTGEGSYENDIISQINFLEQINTGFWGPYFQEVNDALLLYTQIPNANATTVNTILNAITNDVNNNGNGYFGFNTEDLYRSYMPDWSYHWGSNNPKASYGNINRMILNYEIDTPNESLYEQYINEAIHYFHGVNPLGIVYLSNMYEFGATRSVNEIYHGWFADGTIYDHALNSSIGPAPGYITGGPNRNFTVTTLTPPANQPEQKSYLDFNDDWPNNSWEISEPAIYYQAAYIRLLANRVSTTGVLNVPSNDSNINFIIYPNPTSNSFYIANAAVGDMVTIFSLEGKLLLSKILDNTKEIVVNNITSGTYLVQIVQKSGNKKTKKLIIY